MNKESILEAVSYKSRRIKLGNHWISINPFIELNDLRVGTTYQYSVAMEPQSQQWYVSDIKAKEPK